MATPARMRLAEQYVNRVVNTHGEGADTLSPYCGEAALKKNFLQQPIMKQIKFKNSIDRNVFRIKSRDHQRMGIISAVIMIIVILALDASLDNFYDEPKPTVTVEVIPDE